MSLLSFDQPLFSLVFTFRFGTQYSQSWTNELVNLVSKTEVQPLVAREFRRWVYRDRSSRRPCQAVICTKNCWHPTIVETTTLHRAVQSATEAWLYSAIVTRTTILAIPKSRLGTLTYELVTEKKWNGDENKQKKISKMLKKQKKTNESSTNRVKRCKDLLPLLDYCTKRCLFRIAR